MKIRLLNFLIRLGRVFIAIPILIIWILVSVVFWIPWWLITGYDLFDSRLNELVYDLADFFEEIYDDEL